MKNKNNVLALVALALALPGAAHAFSQEKNGIKISVKDFMNNPYANVIDNQNWTITAEDLQKHHIAAMTVKITNNTDKPICISGRSVRLSQAAPEGIAEKFKKRAIVRPILAYFATRFVTSQVIGTIKPVPFIYDENIDFLVNLEEMSRIINQYNIDNAGLLRAGWMIPLAGSIAYGFYLSDLNNQLEILIKQASLDEMTTIAPGKSVEKVILCEGMLSQNFNFSIFNKSHVPVAEFAVDLCA